VPSTNAAAISPEARSRIGRTRTPPESIYSGRVVGPRDRAILAVPAHDASQGPQILSRTPFPVSRVFRTSANTATVASTGAALAPIRIGAKEY
jgi:hypothetical protein